MTLDEFFINVCKAMGWEPTPWRLTVFKFWAKMEGMPFERSWNPLATSRTNTKLKYSKEDIGYGAGNWNSVPVKLYATPEDGVEATVQTLRLEYYPNVRKSFVDQRGYAAAIFPQDFSSWVGYDKDNPKSIAQAKKYGQSIVDFMNQTTAPKIVETETSNILNDVIVIQRDLARLSNSHHPILWKLHKFLRSTEFGTDFEFTGDYRDYA